jgi:hypothetical protein
MGRFAWLLRRYAAVGTHDLALAPDAHQVVVFHGRFVAYFARL